MKSTLIYKLLITVLAIVLVLGGAYAGKTIHETQLQVDRFRTDEEKVKSQLDALKLKLDKNEEFLQKLETDPVFLEHFAREKLVNYAKPDEFIYRFDPDPLTSAPANNLDNTQTPHSGSALGTGKQTTSTRTH